MLRIGKDTVGVEKALEASDEALVQGCRRADGQGQPVANEGVAFGEVAELPA